MAAPSPTARVTPTGIRLEDGYQTLITFENDSNVNLWELEITPPGLDGGDPIDTTTMHNTTYRTKAARSLIDVTDGSFTCAYDPEAMTGCLALVNVEQTITVTFLDGSTWAFWGFMQTFDPQGLSEGEMPEASVGFVITNFDPTVGQRDEQGPVIAEVSGS